MPLEVAPLYLAEDNPDLKRNITNVKLELPSYFSSKVQNLLKQCFEYDPANRIKISAVFAHPWMLKYKDLI